MLDERVRPVEKKQIKSVKFIPLSIESIAGLWLSSQYLNDLAEKYEKC